MTRVLDTARIHVVDPRTAFGVPLAGLGAAVLITLIIHIASSEPSSATGSAGMIGLYAVLVGIHYQSVTRYFPLLLGLSATRREFYLGTTLYVLAQCVAFGLALTLARSVEQLTGGWGLDMQIFSLWVPADAGLLARWPIYTATLLAFASVGLVMGTVFKRWGLPGLYVAVVGLVGLVIATPFIAERLGWSVPSMFATGSVVLPLVGAAVLTGFGWLILRRATP